MYRIKVTIEGIAPLLYNRFTEKAQDDLDKRKTGGVMSQKQRIAEALEKVYRNADGLFLPSHAVKECIVNGASKASLKYGKKGLAPFLKALIFMEDQELSLGKKEPDGMDERIGRRPPRTGGACIIRRPMVNAGWKASFTLVVMDDRIPEEHIKEALGEGGLLVGLLDNRPEFGRFIIKEWRKV